MKQFILTAPSFSGSMLLRYLEGSLVMVDFTESDISDVQKQWMLSHSALHEWQLPEMVAKAKNITCVQDNYEVTLDDFIKEYPYKRNTHLLPDVWKNLNKVEQVQAVIAAKHYKQWGLQRKISMPTYKPMVAASWLNKKEFLNDWKNL